MLEDIRHHDAKPTTEEREWIDCNPVTFAVRFAVLLVFATAIGGYVSLYLEPTPPTVARAEK